MSISLYGKGEKPHNITFNKQTEQLYSIEMLKRTKKIYIEFDDVDIYEDGDDIIVDLIQMDEDIVVGEMKFVERVKGKNGKAVFVTVYHGVSGMTQKVSLKAADEVLKEIASEFDP